METGTGKDPRYPYNYGVMAGSSSSLSFQVQPFVKEFSSLYRRRRHFQMEYGKQPRYFIYDHV